MIKFEYDNEIYYFDKGLLFDSSHLQVPTSEANDILKYYYKTIDYKTLDK